MTDDTVFDKIIQGEIPCEEVYSDKICIAFRDIQPQAPIHILIIPKSKIVSLREAEEKHKEILGHLLLISAHIAKLEGLKDWRTVINTGSDAGQTVFHLHLHLIGGRILSWPPG